METDNAGSTRTETLLVSAGKKETPAPASGTPDRVSSAAARGRTFGRYVVLEKLGAGGMGVVYAAWDQTLDRKVALKLIHSDRIRTEARRAKAVERLVNEARALARLDHPNVVRVIEVNSENDQVFIAMEFVEGLTLRKWLAASVRSWHEIAEVFASAGEGLAAAHSVDMVHGDFKPDNVIVTSSGLVKVLDFGLARGLESPTEGASIDTPSKDIKSVSEGFLRSSSGTDSADNTMEGGADAEDVTRGPQLGVEEEAHARTRAATALAGTPAYMSPEHFLGSRPTFAADQFAFCVALFEALYGERPFQGETATELSMNIMEGALRTPEEVPRRVPPFLRRAVLRGLRVDVGDRFPSIRSLLREIERRPVRRAMRTVAMVGAAVVAISFGMVLQQRMNPSATCSDLVHEIDGVTETEFVGEVVRQIPASRRAPMIKMVEVIERSIDGIADRWRATAQTSCDDLNVRGSISYEEYEMRVRCLDQVRQRLELYLDKFRESPQSAVLGATRALRELPDPSFCARAERSQTGEFDLSDDETTAVRQQLFKLQTAYLHGDITPVEEQLPPLFQAITRLDNPQLFSQALYLKGLTVSWIGRNPREASKVWDQAALAADRARDDYLRLRVELERTDLLTSADQYEQAVSALDRAEAIAHRINLKNSFVWDVIEQQRGFIQMQRGDYKGATETLLEVWKRNEHDPRAWEVLRDVGTLLGLMARDTGKTLEALAYTQRACDLIATNMSPYHPDNTSCQLNLASIYATMKRYDEAHEVYDEIIERYAVDDDSKGNLNLAFVYTLKALSFAEVRQLEAAVPLHRLALREYERLGRLDTADEALEQDNMGFTLLLLGRVEESEAALTRALEVWTASAGEGHADISYPLNHLGVLAMVKGDLAEARLNYEKARALRDAFPQDETDTSLLDFLGALLMYDKDAKAAQALADRAMARLGDPPSGGHAAALARWRAAPRVPKQGASNFEIFEE